MNLDDVSELLDSLRDDLTGAIEDIPNQLQPELQWYERFVMLRNLFRRDAAAVVVLDWPGRRITIRTALGDWSEPLAGVTDGLCWLSAINQFSPGGMVARAAVDGKLVLRRATR